MNATRKEAKQKQTECTDSYIQMGDTMLSSEFCLTNDYICADKMFEDIVFKSSEGRFVFVFAPSFQSKSAKNLASETERFAQKKGIQMRLAILSQFMICSYYGPTLPLWPPLNSLLTNLKNSLNFKRTATIETQMISVIEKKEKKEK